MRQGPRGQEGRTKRVQASKAADPGLQDDDEWGELIKDGEQRPPRSGERRNQRRDLLMPSPPTCPCPARRNGYI